MATQFVFIGIFVAAAIAYNLWMKKNSARQLVAARPAFKDFFERTGYCYPDLLGQPVEAQVDRAYEEANRPYKAGEKFQLDYVRDYHGVPVRYHNAAWQVRTLNKVTSFIENSWSADVSTAPRVPIHIADKSLASMTKLIGEAFTNTTRDFKPKCRTKMTTGIAAIDDKFVVYADDPDAARQVFAQNPGLAALLQNWAELDVCVTEGGAFFNDPSSTNMNAAMGGMVGNLAMGFDYSKRTELTIPVHERAADLLATLVRATA